ncbi:phosphate butyryltransferase [Sporomusaceae bacterium FL31]|nr:phosphate butyryltransferase [Sporomusaceae bacterium FL31]GCE35523.1 phosphate butyryltransferase [Sporomusaceae bacterium]
MYQNYQQVLDQARGIGPLTISVAAAQDKEVLIALKTAQEAGIVKPILVGDKQQIISLMNELGFSAAAIVHESDSDEAAKTAVALVRNGDAQILMKGQINSSNFLKAVLNKEVGLRTGRLLSHLACFEIKNQSNLLFVTDGGMNISPTLAEKKDILKNAMLALNAMGIVPHVAVLAANEVVSTRMPATMDAKSITEGYLAGEFPSGIVEGPIALDVAVSCEAARHKNIASHIAGKVDLMLVPSIETGNILGKALIYYGGAKMAGLVLGASHPIVMTSRAETAEGKLNSIALACLAYEQKSQS